MKQEVRAPRDQIYIDDKAIAARVGLPLREWEATALVLERSGLPRRDPLFRNKRWLACGPGFLG